MCLFLFFFFVFMGTSIPSKNTFKGIQYPYKLPFYPVTPYTSSINFKSIFFEDILLASSQYNK